MNRNRQVLRIVSIARDLSLSPDGVLLSDLSEKYGAVRRTIERDIDALAALGYTIETVRDADTNEGRKRIVGDQHDLPTRLAASEMAAGRAAAAALATIAAPSIAATFRILLDRLEQSQPKAAQLDAAILAAGQSLVSRPRHEPRANPEIVAILQDAILRCVRLRITYRKGGTEPPRQYLAEPYGILYGGKNYLVWRGEDGAYRKFALTYIDAIALTGEIFVNDPSFSLDEYAAGSIGVMADGIMDVCLHIAPAARSRLHSFLFHPSQSIDKQPDGSALVRFEASGLDEICDQIFAWGGMASVIGPPKLAAAYVSKLQTALAAAIEIYPIARMAEPDSDLSMLSDQELDNAFPRN